MNVATPLANVSDAELFAELLRRHQLQAAFALFARVANELATELDGATTQSPELLRILKKRHQQLAAMWTARTAECAEGPEVIAEEQLFHNLMESHIVELASRSDRHRDHFALVVGGPEELDSLQYVRSESAARWMVGQLSQVNVG